MSQATSTAGSGGVSVVIGSCDLDGLTLVNPRLGPSDVDFDLVRQGDRVKDFVDHDAA